VEEEKGSENGSKVKPIGMGKRNKKTLVWNNVPAQMTRPILPWNGDSAENLNFQTLQFLTSSNWWVTP
jgi:hypothetical protein